MKDSSVKRIITSVFEWICDARLIALLALFVAVVFSSFLAGTYFMYMPLYTFLFNWCVIFLIWRGLVKKDIEKKPEVIPLICYLLCEVVTIALNPGLQTVFSLAIDFVLITIFVGIQKKNIGLVFDVYSFFVILFDILCLVSAFDGVTERMGFQQGFFRYSLTGIAANKNVLSIMNFAAVIGAIYSVLSCVNASDKKRKVTYCIFLPVFIVFMLASNSRICVISFIVLMLLLLVFIPYHKMKMNGQRKKSIVFVSVTVGIFALIIIGSVTGYCLINLNDKFGAMWNDLRHWLEGNGYKFLSSNLALKSSNERFKIWKFGFEAFAGHPVFGTGQSLMYDLLEKECNIWTLHSGYFQILFINGIAGAVCFLTAFVMIVIKSIKHIRRTQNFSDVFMLLAMAAIAVVHTMEIGFLIEYRVTGILFWVFAGMLCCKVNNDGKKALPK